MSPPAVCRVLGCEEPRLYEVKGVRFDESGRPIYGSLCIEHERADLEFLIGWASFRHTQLLHLIGEA
jgi:hypothetical protein